MKKEINLLIDKASRSINAARKLCELGDYDFAASRAYYAMFYISEALLITRGMSFSKHAAVISAVFNELVKTNELPKEFHKVLHKAFNLRQESDYLTSNRITEEIALNVIDEADKQVGIAIQWLKNHK